MAKCEHRTVERFMVLPFGTVAFRCADWGCNAIGVRPLGPSNDEPEAVRVETRAAELEVNPRVSIEEWPRGMVDLEPYGWLGHRRGDSPIEPTATYFAGWLARELATHDNRETRDASAWPWDPTRPVAEQFEEYLKAQQYAQDEALRRETYESNAPVRAAARAMIEAWPDDDTPTPVADDDPDLQAGGPALTMDECAAYLTKREAEVAAFDAANSPCDGCDAPFGCDPGRCYKESDDPDPATKFGALAKQAMVLMVAQLLCDYLDDEHHDPVDSKFDDGGDCDEVVK